MREGTRSSSRRPQGREQPANAAIVEAQQCSFRRARTLRKVDQSPVTGREGPSAILSFDGTQHRAIEDARNMAKLFAKVAKPLSIV